jgi:hypothetical protein
MALANATITAPPVSTFRDFSQTVEIVYSYRFEGELYTGSHEELFLFRPWVDRLSRTIRKGNPVGGTR